MNERCPMEMLKHVTSVLYVDQLKSEPTGALILLHGSRGSGKEFYESIKNTLGEAALFPHVKLIFPTAPLTHYSPLGGAMVTTWFNISGFSMDAAEDEGHINNIAHDLIQLVNHEVECGIPVSRIVIAGFSRGEGMSFHMGYRYIKGLAGVGVISSFLPTSSLVYKELRNCGKEPFPLLFHQHGVDDNLVDYNLAKKTFQNLQDLGVKGDHRSYDQLGHEISKKELEEFYQFIYSVIPDNL
ncbi:lysophospholipase-like protein 1 [Cimex lectularius]|uniref:palmitoyl-protein hydrolase n=1 Tax=Cimex lectularius TaxID=79782 RepID=A0A8I6SKU2_CIMLE|nr:lysophospholipase-like protein 1 [Cimex lectularius]